MTAWADAVISRMRIAATKVPAATTASDAPLERIVCIAIILG
jgi:hypothetical protein